MLNIGMPELVVILIVALIVLGPDRLPEVAKMLGKAMAEFRKMTAGLTNELENARAMIEEEARKAARDAERPPKITPASGAEPKTQVGAAPSSPPPASGGETSSTT